MRINSLTMALCAIIMAGCALTAKVDDLNLPNPPELKMRDVKWDVLYYDDEAKMCLSPRYYSNLSMNMHDVQVYMVYQNKIIKIYKENR